jgi:DNA-binding beta-propeller fold protein YncE
MNVPRFSITAVGLVLAASCSGTINAINTTPAVSRSSLSGVVESGTHAIAGASVTLYAMGTSGSATGAAALGHASSAASGKFVITYNALDLSGNLYAIATGGNAGSGANSAIGLGALVAAAGSRAKGVTINERSTVALEFALAQFADPTGTLIGASASNTRGINDAALLDRERLVDPATADPAPFFPHGSSCAGSGSPENCEGLERLNAIGDALAACTSSSGASSAECLALDHATDVSGKTTLASAHALALDPSRDPNEIYLLAKSNDSYLPRTAKPPSAWTLALKYYGNGKEFDGPGNIAFDAQGNLWIGNNYTYNADPRLPACGGKEVIELTALGDDALGAPFSGGGVDGVGWGTTIDLGGHVWVGNFGFAGKGCLEKPKDKSASEFDPNGTAISPDDGWKEGPLDRPQGTVTNLTGDIWFANFGNGTVTVYRAANHNRSAVFANLGLKHPFGEAVDASNRVWVTGEGSNNVALLDADGVPVTGSPFSDGIKRPLGDAIDMEGDVWISNNGGASVTVLDSSTHPILGSPITGGGVRLPWGIAVDGNDNVWVADFFGSVPRISEICGRRDNCPRGLHAGEPITPTTGYGSRTLQRLTAVAIDQSGNVWVCDNWRRIPIRTNPGGDGMTEFVGLAGPVKSPARGPVQRP